MSSGAHDPQPKWVGSVLNCEHHISRTAIMLAQIYPPDPSTHDLTSDAEPLPRIDYHLVHSLIYISRASLDKHDMKRFEYVIHARKLYYTIHYNFQLAYRSLQDAYAYSIILDKQKEEYETRAATNLEGLKYNEEARTLNLRHMEHFLDQVTKLAKKRNDVSVFFSHMKWIFLETDMPRLVSTSKHLYRKSMGLEVETSAQ